MWDYSASEYFGEDLYRGYPSTVPGWHDVQLFFWEPSANINPHVAQRPIVSNEPINRVVSLSSAAEQLFFELNSSLTWLLTERLNDAGSRRYDTTTTLPYNGSHYGAGWVGRLNWIWIFGRAVSNMTRFHFFYPSSLLLLCPLVG